MKWIEGLEVGRKLTLEKIENMKNPLSLNRPNQRFNLCLPHKVPGPYGFNDEFFQTFKEQTIQSSKKKILQNIDEGILPSSLRNRDVKFLRK